MASTKSLDIRWLRRYRIFFIVGSIILSIQVFLAFKFFPIDVELDENVQEHRGLSGKGKINIENLNEDLNGGVSSRRFKENYIVVDDEDSPSNSNPVNGIYNKVKVPPDKIETNIRKHLFKGKTVVSKLYNRTSMLRLEELDFVPACEISTKEAISAIHRAKTQLCKQQLANLTCLSQEGLLYPTYLPSSCPAPGFSAGKSLGCYRDEKTFRLLSGYYANLKNTNSPQNCINMCLQSGFSYAGVQYSTECFCGAEEPPSTSRLPDSSCNMKCPADPKQACGGFFTINVYQTGIAKFSPQVPKEISENSSETPIRVAFLLTLNGRALRQVKRLIKILFHTDHYFYIHVDARQDYLYRELLILESLLPNLRLARHRFATIWGGASLLQMLLKSMDDLLKSDWKWDFIINLSESDFPVKTNDQLVNFLTANKGKNFVKSHGREVQRFIQKQGLDKTFVECDAHMWRAGDRSLPCGLQIDGGSDWVALSRPFVEYVAGGSERNDPLLIGLEAVFRHTLLPAESFFHTALRNSQFCGTYVDNNLHVTNWKRRLGCKCQYKHVVDWCGCSPNDFKSDDWPRIQGTASRQLFFARKFEPIINQAIIDQVEEWLYGIYPTNIPNLHAYWQNIYHSTDLSPPADDSLLTIATSKARVALKNLSDCKINYLRVLEVTSYLFNDNYKGSLILYEGNFKGLNNTFKFETWAKPNFHFTILKDYGPIGRLKQLFVSSDFDQKEQLSRNLFMTLGPFSEPAAIFHFAPSTSTYNVSFLWVDPVGQIADISEFHIEEGNVINHVKSSLRDPLLPGIWTVNLVYNLTIVAQTQFLITPLQFVSGAQVSQQQAGFLHSNSVALSNIQEDFEKLLNISLDKKNNLHRKMIANARRFGPDLNEWIDNLTTKFYKIIDTCLLLIDQVDYQCLKSKAITRCQDTLWSSFAPDPKSLITKVNLTSGRLNR